MAVCPRCRKRLLPTKIGAGVFFRCRQCDGRAAAVSFLRRTISPGYVNRLWLRARGRDSVPGAACPICQKRMAQVELPVGPRNVPLDVCVRCQFVWFDPGEFEQFPAQPREPSLEERLPQKARERVAILEVEREAQRAEEEADASELPNEPWKWLPAVLGMPVECSVNPLRCWPWATWWLAASMTIIFALSLNNLEHVVEEFGMVPAMPWRHGGITFVTSFLLHGSLFHLVGNMYFLVVFGNHVEDHLGPWRFLALVGGSALAGAIAHNLGDSRSMLPCVGASGGISGVIVFYALDFPHARLGFLFSYWTYFRWFSMPAYAALLFWLLLQCLLAAEQLAGLGNVSALAHLGGAAVGLAAWLATRLPSPA